jgi:AcrR family transcriptional regulator
MPSLREVQKRMTRSLLIDAALQLFAEQGLAGTTVDDIASRAGATRATFYLHFGSKTELVRALVSNLDELFGSHDVPSLPDTVEAGTPEAIRAWVEKTTLRWSEIRPYLITVHQANAEPELAALVEAWHDDVIQGMADALDRVGRFDPETRRIRCALAFGLTENLSRRWVRLGWSVDREIVVDQLTDAWCGLLSGDTRD